MINEFKGDYRWLSNFEAVTITIDGNSYPSVEHAYMAAKCDDPEWKSIAWMQIILRVMLRKNLVK